jgi:hypothetical protein
MAEAQRSRNWKRSAVLFAEKGKNGGGGREESHGSHAGRVGSGGA